MPVLQIKGVCGLAPEVAGPPPPPRPPPHSHPPRSPALEALARGSGSLKDILAALEGLSPQDAEALLVAAEGA